MHRAPLLQRETAPPQLRTGSVVAHQRAHGDFNILIFAVAVVPAKFRASWPELFSDSAVKCVQGEGVGRAPRRVGVFPRVAKKALPNAQA